MFASKIALVSALAASALGATNNARFERVVHRAVPAQYRRGYAQDGDLLEPYAQYNSRYMNFNCPDQHGTKFFDLCCHPRLKENQDNDFDASCYEDCDDGDDGPHSSVVGRESSAPVNVPVETSAPEPTTTSRAAPETTPAPSKPTTTKKPSEPKPTTSVSSGGGGGGADHGDNNDGQATFFYQNNNPGACGITNPDSKMIAAIQKDRYGNLGRVSPLCGKQVKIWRVGGEKRQPIVVTIADACPSCEGKNPKNSIDLSVGAFEALGDLSEGVIPISWSFV